MNEQNGALKAQYIRVWLSMLTEFVNWTEDEAMTWIGRWELDLDNPASLIYHKDPEYWITGVLIRRDFDRSLSIDNRVALRHEIEDVFREAYDDLSLLTDWKHYKAKIIDVIEKYGGQLPDKPSLDEVLPAERQ